MKKIDFGKAITLIANIGVIGGILLLAYELRQNNELMEAEARQNRMDTVVDFWMFIAEHSDFADIKERSQNGEELSGVETPACRLSGDGHLCDARVDISGAISKFSRDEAGSRRANLQFY